MSDVAAAIQEDLSLSRKLAYIATITDLSPIPGADRIEVAQILNWKCVVKKGEYSVGSKVIFIEVDARLPAIPQFEFMRERKFKVKAIKLKQQVSQGLVVPLKDFPEQLHDLLMANTILEDGQDLTKLLGITNYVKEVEDAEEAANANVQTKMPRWLMDMAWFRWIYFKMNPKDKGWPVSAGPRTDETRIQVVAKYLMEHYDEEWYITEKIDGQSGTFFTYLKKIWGITHKKFGVCSRKIFLKTKNQSSYWRMADKYDLQEKLMRAESLISVQGEVTGPSIQSNKYKLPEVRLYVFNVIVNGVRMSLQHTRNFCEENGLTMVPVLNESFIPSRDIGTGKTVQEVVDWMLTYAKGQSKIGDHIREGIVMRLASNPTVSLKVISPDWVVKEAKRDET